MWLDVRAVSFSVGGQGLQHKWVDVGSLIVDLFEFWIEFDKRIDHFLSFKFCYGFIDDLTVQFQSVGHVQGEKHNDKEFGHLVL